MPITLIIGPMFSGKTSELIRLVDRKRIAGKKCIIVKHVKDNRCNIDNDTSCEKRLVPLVITHSNYHYNQCDIVYVENLDNQLTNDLIEQKYDVIGIEEGHFFPGLKKFCSVLANNNTDVIVSALDSSFEQKLFIEVGQLIANAENVIKLNAICMICNNADASFTIRTIDSNEQILVGGIDIYKSVCRTCLNNYKIININ